MNCTYEFYSLEEQKEMYKTSRQSPEKAKEIYTLWLNSLMPLIYKTARMDEDVVQYCCLYIWQNLPFFNPHKAKLITYFWPIIMGARNVVLNHNSVRTQKEYIKFVSLPEGADIEKKKVNYDDNIILSESLTIIKKEVPQREYDIWYRRKIGEQLSEIGKAYSICRERVRQIEEKVNAWVAEIFEEDKNINYAEFSTAYERKRYQGIL